MKHLNSPVTNVLKLTLLGGVGALNLADVQTSEPGPFPQKPHSIEMTANPIELLAWGKRKTPNQTSTLHFFNCMCQNPMGQRNRAHKLERPTVLAFSQASSPSTQLTSATVESSTQGLMGIIHIYHIRMIT